MSIHCQHSQCYDISHKHIQPNKTETEKANEHNKNVTGHVDVATGGRVLHCFVIRCITQLCEH